MTLRQMVNQVVIDWAKGLDPNPDKLITAPFDMATEIADTIEFLAGTLTIVNKVNTEKLLECVERVRKDRAGRS